VFISASLDTPCCNEHINVEVLASDQSGFQVRVSRTKAAGSTDITTSSVKVQASSDAAPNQPLVLSQSDPRGWTQTLRLRWTVRQLPSRDAPMSGLLPIGKSSIGSVDRTVLFPSLFRRVPRDVLVQPYLASHRETFTSELLSVAQDRFTVRIKRVGLGKERLGWTEDLSVTWKALPYSTADDDNRKPMTLDDVSYLSAVNLPHGNLPNMPVQLSPAGAGLVGKGHTVCARLCLANPQCRAFSYHFVKDRKRPQSPVLLEERAPVANTSSRARAPPALLETQATLLAALRAAATCPNSQAEYEELFGGYCYLKGAVSDAVGGAWKERDGCSVSGVLDDPARHVATGHVFKIAPGGCDTTNLWATRTHSKRAIEALTRLGGDLAAVAACPMGSVLTGFRFSSSHCAGGLYPLLHCMYPPGLDLSTTTTPAAASCSSQNEWGVGPSKLSNLINLASKDDVCPTGHVARGVGVEKCIGQAGARQLRFKYDCLPVTKRGPLRDVRGACDRTSDFNWGVGDGFALSALTRMSTVDCPANHYVVGVSLTPCVGDNKDKLRLRLQCARASFS